MVIAGPHQLYAAIIRPALTNKGCMYVCMINSVDRLMTGELAISENLGSLIDHSFVRK